MAFVNLMDIVYPVGSLYFTTTSVSPSSTIGGTWTKLEDHTLVGSGGNGTYYGDKLIPAAAMPYHSHDVHYDFNGTTNLGIHVNALHSTGYAWTNGFQGTNITGSTDDSGNMNRWAYIRTLPDDQRATAIQKICKEHNGAQDYTFGEDGHGKDGNDDGLLGDAGSFTNGSGGFAPFYPYQFDCNIYYRTA